MINEIFELLIVHCSTCDVRKKLASRISMFKVSIGNATLNNWESFRLLYYKEKSWAIFFPIITLSNFSQNSFVIGKFSSFNIEISLSLVKLIKNKIESRRIDSCASSKTRQTTFDSSGFALHDELNIKWRPSFEAVNDRSVCKANDLTSRRPFGSRNPVNSFNADDEFDDIWSRR